MPASGHLDDGQRNELAYRLDAACAERVLGREHTGGLAIWSAYQLTSACVGVDLWTQAKGTGDGVVEGHGLVSTGLAAINLVARGVSTALDLNAAILWDLVEGERTSREKDLEEIIKLADRGQLAGLCDVERDWLEDLRTAPDRQLLKATRDALTHRTLPQGTTVGRGVQLQVAGQVHELDDLLPRLLRFGDSRFAAFVEAVEA